jgi:NAD(P)-dependent dehydrogenase (short-subunit alcohol dehydrogenase family)
MGSDLFNLKDRTVVVTGGMGQLGQQFSLSLVQAGARVACVDVVKEPRKGDQKFLELLSEKKQLKAFTTDITKPEEIKKTFQEIKSSMGVPWGLVNNAALDSPPNASLEENGPFESYPEASLRKIMDVNVLGTTFACQVFGEAMAQNDGGSIINIASIYGLVSPNQDIYEFKREGGKPWFKPVAYSISKSAVFNLTRYLATYWAKQNVRVNTITPAGIFNNQDQKFLDEYLKRMPMGRMAKPDELNGAVVFLMSDASSYMTGSNLVIDGGWTAW